VNLLFDLDGTLTDPRQGILACFRHAFHALGSNALPNGELEKFIGPPLRESFSAVLRDPVLVEQAVALYRERFAAKGMFENRLYPGIHGALEHLRRSGFRLFVATAKPSAFAERILEYFELRRFFSGVYGSELDGRNGNKADLLAELLKAEALLPADVVMIGDRAHDVLGAKANGIFAVGVLWGFSSRQELAEAGADLLCASPRDLIKNLNGGRL
jgi:phosphoglycolate phosphatase